MEAESRVEETEKKWHALKIELEEAEAASNQRIKELEALLDELRKKQLTLTLTLTLNLALTLSLTLSLTLTLTLTLTLIGGRSTVKH